MNDFTLFRGTAEFLVVGMAGYLFTVYVLAKREFHFHSLVVTLLALTYIIGGMPHWLIAHEFRVKLALVVLCAGLIGRALRFCSPKGAFTISLVVLFSFFAWRIWARLTL